MRKVSAAGIGAAAVLTAAFTLGMPYALAEGPNTVALGDSGEITNGDLVQAWKVESLRPSTDQIDYQPKGTLWEATATDEAIRGSVIPMVSNFNARAANGDTYRALFGVATPEGVNPGSLSPGEKTSGKLYFDVTGAEPDSVVYRNNVAELMIWTQPLETAPQPGGQAPVSQAPATQAPSQTAAPTTSPSTAAAEAEDEDQTAEGSQGTPVSEAGEDGAESAGSTGTPAEEGSQGTPVSEGTPAESGSQGTPVQNEGTPVSGAQGTPVETEGAPAGGSQGTPVENAGTPVSGGSQGTPIAGQPHGPQPASAPLSAGTPAS